MKLPATLTALLLGSVARWITPSIFQQFQGHDTVDEYTLCKNHPDQAKSILQKHWQEWATQDDFQKIYNAGFNAVRIPIGYWAFKKFDGDPYVEGAADYLDQAIGWARATKLKVVVDLHGAPGSQNGYDNSGHNGTVDWGDGSNIAYTRAVLQLIANKYAKQEYQDVVVGIELLNEPLPTKIEGGTDPVVQYYKDTYGVVRSVSDTPAVLHDAFQPGSFWHDILTPPDGQGVVIDHHEYQVFNDTQVLWSHDEHVGYVCSNADTYVSNVNHWHIVGEWSAAMTDCAAALNGYGVGSRYEGNYITSQGSTGRSCGNINYIDQWDDQLKKDTQRYITAQLDVYTQRANGYFFWNFKTEGSPEWDLFRLLGAGVFPNLQNYQPSSVCS
ncbi:uncharacterized protein KY384_001566 [Bacidia gigantensis]|uniref:uncharacterized protein n=1 Tax=Bacidia gigantensis TaxID=2732470 RepID=UPI001D035EBA|nr:uncharacterized protein KY384_001566 [Bacidia gigantensis]KAG8533825.1 hypothetical protein KY384_001566 [Bacidia gigantensis]